MNTTNLMYPKKGIEKQTMNTKKCHQRRDAKRQELLPFVKPVYQVSSSKAIKEGKEVGTGKEGEHVRNVNVMSLRKKKNKTTTTTIKQTLQLTYHTQVSSNSDFNIQLECFWCSQIYS